MINRNDADGILEMLRQFQKKGIKRVTEEDVDALFAIGQGYFERELYEDALRIFALLAIVRHTDPRVLGALGKVHQRLGDHLKAVQYLGIAQLADLSDPVITFDFAASLRELGALEEARQALEVVVNQTSGVAGHAALCTRARMMRDALMTSKEFQ
jgi:tetratricopeptide (TPR) repeat protein